MKTRTNALWWILEKVVPWLVLAILLTYSYAKFFRHSYGFRVEPITGLVVFVFDKQPEPTLRENDRILQIGSVPWEDIQANLFKSFFEGYEPGTIVPLTVERDSQIMKIDWMYPSGPGREEVVEQLISEWFIAYFFWLAGLLTILLVRPKDDSWLLMSLFNFLTAIWLIAGSGLSAYHIWYSAIVLRVAVWLCLPVYLHLHWVFPRPLGRLPRWLVGIVYGVGILFAIAQAFQLLPNGLYILAFLIALGGSLLLLIIHFWRQPSIRKDFRLPLVALLLAVAPAMIWTAFDRVFGIPSVWGSAGVLSLPILPLAYLYAAFRRRLGNLELRVNRFFTLSLFIIILVMVGLPLIALAEYALNSPNEALIIGSAAAGMTIIVCLWVYPAFERFLERRLLNIRLPSKHLLETYSTHITTSLSVSELVRVLQEDILPSLLIRQFAFLHYDQGSLNVLSRMGLDTEPLPQEQDVPYLTDQSGIYRSPDILNGDQPYSWIRLILPLKLGDRLIGFWLLGRRDPDDFYSQQEIPTLSSLANLTAIALSTILQTERLRLMYEANINRYEQERLRLAHELHDSILNELAALLMRADAPNLSPKFLQAFDELTERLRDIVDDLRPPMLAFGLKLTLEDLAETLRERIPDSVEIRTDLQADGDCRYPSVVENNLYRIVQEACENSLRYSHAKKIILSGRLDEKEIHIRVEDDGIGLHPEISLKLNDLLAGKHFGLAGMHERAGLIGAEMVIHSQKNEGTQIQVTWKAKETM